MTVYYDRVGHLVADTLEELHAFAWKLGLSPAAFKYTVQPWHYELVNDVMRLRASGQGAKLVTVGAIEQIALKMSEKVALHVAVGVKEVVDAIQTQYKIEFDVAQSQWVPLMEGAVKHVERPIDSKPQPIMTADEGGSAKVDAKAWVSVDIGDPNPVPVRVFVDEEKEIKDSPGFATGWVDTQFAGRKLDELVRIQEARLAVEHLHKLGIIGPLQEQELLARILGPELVASEMRAEQEREFVDDQMRKIFGDPVIALSNWEDPGDPLDSEPVEE